MGGLPGGAAMRGVSGRAAIPPRPPPLTAGHELGRLSRRMARFAISTCGEAGLSVTANENCFDTSKNWFEFGIDVFQAKSGSDEGMCIEITNPTYNAYEAATLSPPFVTDCDMTSFPFKDTRPKGTPEVTHDVTCKFVR